MTNEKLKSLRPRTRGVILVAFLWVLQSVGRLYFAILGTPWGMEQFLDVRISHAVSLVVFLMFLLLGVWGLVAAFGLLRGRKWGFWNITLVSIVTIAFDIWGLTIQYTAAIGFIVPAISILYLYHKKTQLLATLN
jgi:hypothetical protein